MSQLNTYANSTPRVTNTPVVELLDRVLPVEIWQKMGKVYNIGKNKSDTASFMRYEPLGAIGSSLEGVSPQTQQINQTKINVPLRQFINAASYTDKLRDMGEKEAIDEYGKVLMEQQVESRDLQAYYGAIAGTNVVYSNGVARNAVASEITIAKQRQVIRALKGGRAKFVREVLRSTPNYDTRNVEPAFVCITSSDADGDIRSLPGFVPVADYGKMDRICDDELGSVDDVRYITHSAFRPFVNSGAANNAAYICGGGTGTGTIDVYPYVFFGADAFGHTSLRDAFAVEFLHAMPKAIAGLDPAAQQGSIAVKSWYEFVILNQSWLVRGEFAVRV
jgi:N4-gp56 family major capsid protein